MSEHGTQSDRMCAVGHHHFVKIKDAIGEAGTPYWQCLNTNCQEVRARSGRAVQQRDESVSAGVLTSIFRDGVSGREGSVRTDG